MDDTRWLKDAIDKLDSKVDKLDQRLDKIDDRHNTNTGILKEHIYRTELNEENILLLREELKPMQRDVMYIHGGLKLVGGIALLAGLAESAVKIFEFFSP